MRTKSFTKNNHMLVEMFRKELRLRGRSNTTSKCYELCLKRFLNYHQRKDLSLLVVMRQMRNKDLASSSSLYRVTTVEV
jgi:hypothetical protein